VQNKEVCNECQAKGTICAHQDNVHASLGTGSLHAIPVSRQAIKQGQTQQENEQLPLITWQDCTFAFRIVPLAWHMGKLMRDNKK